MDADTELNALKLRVSLLEKILLRVWVSELASVEAGGNRETARKMAEDALTEFTTSIPQETPSARSASGLFAARVRDLKSFVQTLE
jgi:hypothetical protein